MFKETEKLPDCTGVTISAACLPVLECKELQINDGEGNDEVKTKFLQMDVYYDHRDAVGYDK